MSKVILVAILIFSLAMPAKALELEAPRVPKSGEELMPRTVTSFGEGIRELGGRLLHKVRPDLAEAGKVSLGALAAVILVSLLETCSGNVKKTAEFAGAASIVTILLNYTNSMIHLGVDTIRELSDYGTLLFPVMTTALAAQGGLTASAALYTGTTAFDVLLCFLISRLLMPGVYVFLALGAANAAAGEEMLKKLRDLIKNAISWCLKTVLTVFTAYMSITGVVSGTTDAAALKATKMTISAAVPVVGGVLANASEAVLVSGGLVKNAAGVYGILAMMAVFLEPFLKIGIHYLVWKATAAFGSLFGAKSAAGLIEDFSTAMGLLLAMTGAVCLLSLISCICFLKGVGG